MKSLVILALAGALLAGCSHTAVYNSAYLSAPPPAASERMDGKVLVYTERNDDGYVYSGHPTSFTGGGTTLSEPLGQITREVAVYVYGRHFKGGAESGNALDKLDGYRVVVHPRLVNFNYEYNQLQNLGFAITPGVTLEIEVQMLDAAGRPAFSKKYASGLVQGKSYMVSGEPGERINQLVHETMYKLMDESAVDMKAALRKAASPQQ